MVNKSIVFFNSEVHNLLEDQPGKEQVLNKLESINSLEKWDKKIAYYITSKKEFRDLENLIRLIHENILESDDNVFYVKIPIELYQWLRNSDFKQIINQISSFFAYLLLEDSANKNQRSILIDNFLDIIRDQILKIKKEISQIEIGYSDLKKYLPFFKKQYPEIYYLDRELIYRLFKYWKYFEKRFDSLPPIHFLSSYSNSDKFNYIDQNRYFLKITEFGSRKGYKDIQSNRWKKKPNDFEYCDLHLSLWKQLYRDNIKQETYFLDDEIKIIKESYRYNLKDFLQCQICRSNLEFEGISGLKIPDMHPLLCSNCYLEKYFEKH